MHITDLEELERMKKGMNLREGEKDETEASSSLVRSAGLEPTGAEATLLKLRRTFLRQSFVTGTNNSIPFKCPQFNSLQ
ncbi:hypothetical protein CDAR_319471 [Caerostris darwini]|uniref:Uncharacterized protein n=1 Tax=Caerostris darwini TaxID=1538125 RepID=A0AAV4V9D1_9ARAC|nr:hypothetical protein CDAR_319471 [Caerostris darwini]